MSRLIILLGVFMLPLAMAHAMTPPAMLFFDQFTVISQPQFENVRPGGEFHVAVRFNMAKDWHFYADSATAPGGMKLKVSAQGEHIEASDALYPEPHWYFDPSSEQRLRAFSDSFVVYVPVRVSAEAPDGMLEITIPFNGAACSDMLCTLPEGTMAVSVSVDRLAVMDSPEFEVDTALLSSGTQVLWAGGAARSMALWVALPLALLAGIVLNIMPCVWPVIPIVVTRLADQGGRGRGFLHGLSFSAGLMAFFALFAAINVVLQLAFGKVLQFTDLSQNATYLTAMSLVLVALALFMFGVFNISLPSSLAGKAGGGKLGSAGTGFLAAILATPCSFGILIMVLVWAQTQPILPATLAILTIGVGMALPYVLLAAVPGLLGRMPRPGKWMDIAKQSVGFLILLIAVKQISGLPTDLMVSILYFTPIMAFSLWMWGGWVDYAAPAAKRWSVRVVAVGLAILAGWYFFSADNSLIDWQEYDDARISAAIDEGRPVLIDFTASWCFNCTVLDKLVYTRRDVAELIESRGVLPIKGDATLRDYPAARALRDVYNEPALPVNVLLVPGQEEPLKMRGIAITDELLEALEALPARERLTDESRS